jgi:hypothetical protein
MKDIKNFLTEANNTNLELDRFQQWKPNSEFIWINTYQLVYGFMSREDVESLNDLYSPADDDIKAILALKPGEQYAADAESYYIRIKK